MKALGCLAIIVIAALCIVLGMAWAGVAIGAAGAWFFSMPFDLGWHLAWEKPWVLFGWGILFVSAIKLGFNSN